MKKQKVILIAFIAAAALPVAFGSFGPLNPSARPFEREYIWPEGKMPDFQPEQIAAKTDDVKAPGFKREENRRPYIEWFRPKGEANGICMLVVSGGGFMTCCDAARLQPAIDRFVEKGMWVANLTYRTPRPKNLPIYQSAWEDAQRAVRIVKSQAARRGYSPDKVGAIGISAGAKTVLLLATSSQTPAYRPIDDIDKLSVKLLFAIPQAPAYVLNDGATGPNERGGNGPDIKIVPELKFDSDTCPMCFFQGGSDQYSPRGSSEVYRQLRRMKIPAELHFFADRTHGFHGNLNKGEEGAGYDHWFYRAEEFIRQMNFDGKLGAEVDLMSRFPDDSARAKYSKADLWPAGKMPSRQQKQCVPYLEWHHPKTLKTKAVQIIYSGGSYMGNGPDGFEVAPARRYLNEKGMTVVTVKYRTPRPEAPLAKHTTAWQDLQRAIRIVRSDAVKYGLDPDRIGIMGSSAGGHLTLMGATSSRSRSYLDVDETDKISAAVQWAVAIYPAYALTDGAEKPNSAGGNEDDARLVGEFAFDLSTPSILFIHGDADGWAAMNSVKCWEKLRAMGIQGELHTLAKRGHCFQRKAAPGTGSYTWLDRIWEFMNHKKINR